MNVIWTSCTLTKTSTLQWLHVARVGCCRSPRMRSHRMGARGSLASITSSEFRAAASYVVTPRDDPSELAGWVRTIVHAPSAAHANALCKNVVGVHCVGPRRL